MKFVKLTQMNRKTPRDAQGLVMIGQPTIYVPDGPVLINLEHVTHIEPLPARAIGPYQRAAEPTMTGISLADGSESGPTYLQVEEDFETIERMIKRNQEEHWIKDLL